MGNKLLSRLVFVVARWLFRGPLVRRSPWLHIKVMKLLRYASERGNRDALSLYGHLLHFRGEDQASRIQGAIYLERAAELGDVKAAYQMGRVYEKGFEGYFQATPERSVAFYRQAASAGHTLAIKRMFEIYQHGELGVSVDQQESDRWASLRSS